METAALPSLPEYTAEFQTTLTLALEELAKPALAKL